MGTSRVKTEIKKGREREKSKKLIELLLISKHNQLTNTELINLSGVANDISEEDAVNMLRAVRILSEAPYEVLLGVRGGITDARYKKGTRQK